MFVLLDIKRPDSGIACPWTPTDRRARSLTQDKVLRDLTKATSPLHTILNTEYSHNL